MRPGRLPARRAGRVTRTPAGCGRWTLEDLEKLSTKELHDRAVKLAVHRLDAGFLWSLASELPAAEVAAGNLQDAEVDVLKVSALVNDIVHSGEGEIAEALRPLYLQYLREHGS